MTDPASAIALLQEMDDRPVEWDNHATHVRELNGLANIVSNTPTASLHDYRPLVERDEAKAQYTITVTDQLLAATKHNEGAFITAFKQEMEAAMNEYKSSINTQCWGNNVPAQPLWTPEQGVKDAKRALKQAKKNAKRERRAQKAAARYAAQQHADHELGLETLREICEDGRKYSADARVEAAKELLARTGL